jgi:hypothetical protein
MELDINKSIKNIETLPDKITNNIKNDIYKIIDFIAVNFDVKIRGSDKILSPQSLHQYISNNFNILKSETCQGITTSGTRCSLKSYLNSKYCKKHQQLKNPIINHYNNLHNLSNKTPILMINEKEFNSNDILSFSDIDLNKLFTKKLIDNTFYHIDHKYIYDIETNKKVGYIEDDKYILTDDPFELGIQF